MNQSAFTKSDHYQEGIAHLLGESLEHQDIIWIEPKDLRPHPLQPRKTFHEVSLQELAVSIQQHGILQPILVRAQENYYEIIAGERRWRAAQIIHMGRIPCRILSINDEQILEIGLLENVQRKDLSPIEEARAYQQLTEKFHYTQEQIAKKIGKSRSHISNLLRLLTLPPTIQHQIDLGSISLGHAKVLLTSSSPEQDIQAIKDHNMSVRKAEQHIKNKQQAFAYSSHSPQHNNSFFEGIAELEHHIQKKVEKRVQVKFVSEFSKGSVEFFFDSPNELSAFLSQYFEI